MIHDPLNSQFSSSLICIFILILGCLFLLLLFFPMGCTEIQVNSLDAILRSAQSSVTKSPDEQTVAAGLKEALRVGTARAVDATSRIDGFLANALIRIMLPEQLDSMAKTLRTVGLDSQVDALEVAMNRAAELAAGEAREIFWDAISRMTLADAYAILKGGETAATEYFQNRTSDHLRIRFRPIISAKMKEVRLYQIYEQLISRYNALPFVTKPAVDFNEYITEKALSGLFTILGQEEKRIREDPAARTTELLRQVFGI